MFISYDYFHIFLKDQIAILKMSKLNSKKIKDFEIVK